MKTLAQQDDEDLIEVILDPRALFASGWAGGGKSVCEGKEALGTRMR